MLHFFNTMASFFFSFISVINLHEYSNKLYKKTCINTQQLHMNVHIFTINALSNDISSNNTIAKS